MERKSSARSSSRSSTDFWRLEAQLNDRINKIYQKMSKSKPSGQKIRLNQGTLDFVDAHWRETVNVAKQRNPLNTYKAFIECFNKELEQRISCSEITEKVDRYYVDTLLREIEISAREGIETSIQNVYVDIRAEVDQAKDMINTIREHFEQTLDDFRKEVIRFKKSLTEDNESEFELLTHSPQHVIPHRQVRGTFMIRERTIKKPAGVCKSPLRHKTRPFVPKELDSVCGSSLNHLSPRVCKSQMINHKNSKYTVPF